LGAFVIRLRAKDEENLVQHLVLDTQQVWLRLGLRDVRQFFIRKLLFLSQVHETIGM